MTALETSSRWGLLPVAIVLTMVLALRLGAVSSQASFGRDELLRGLVFTVAASSVAVRVFGAASRIDQETLFGALLVATAVLVLVRRERRVEARWEQLVSLDTVPMVAVATISVLTSAVAAYLLPVWQWDALGYHLPYVNFALERGSLGDVPRDLPYLSTYPHVVEHCFIAWRAMLPDDRLVDAAQLPFGALGVVAVAVLARELGARHDGALAAGLAWLTLPAVFLQLPTNYIDVATAALLLSAAAFTLGTPSRQNVLGAGVALGLLLGSKPNAPIATALLFSVVLVRGWLAGRRASMLVAASAILVLGAESYVRNLIGHGNPIWPVRLTVGPVSLPGLLPIQALLESGCAAPRLQGPLLVRLLRSWTSLDAPPVFDMRYGGLGLVFLAALPAALVVAWRRRSLALAAVAVATLASPDPAVPRYILAFPGVVFAVSSPLLDGLGPRSRRTLFLLVAAGQGFGLLSAYPGLTGEGPPLAAYARMTEHQRLRAVGADGSPAAFYDALDRLSPQDVTVFDSSLELPYLAWSPDLSTRARWVGDGVSALEAEQIVKDQSVRLLIVNDGSPLATVARRDERFIAIHHCKVHVPPQCLARESATGDSRGPSAFTQSSSCIVLFRH